jgi:hypothetical protein
MAEVSSGAGTAMLRALLNQGLIRAEASGADAVEGMRRKSAEVAGQTIVAGLRLDGAQEVALPNESDRKEWNGGAGGSYGYLPNATTLAAASGKPTSDVAPATAGNDDGARPAHAINGDQRATSLRSHLAWQEDQIDDGDEGIYSPILKVTRRANANL